jgi:hypothetical protein
MAGATTRPSEIERTSITVPRLLVERLRRIAAGPKVSTATVIREAPEEKANKVRPLLKSPGIADSGCTDTPATLATETTAARPKPHLGLFDSGYTDTSEVASQGPVPPVSWR